MTQRTFQPPCRTRAENRTASVALPLNTPSTTFSIVEEQNRARSKSISIVTDQGVGRLVATIQSGTADEGRGFYYLKLKPEKCPPQGCAPPVPPHGHYMQVTFFDGTDAAGGSIFLQVSNTSYAERPLAANMTRFQLAATTASLAEQLGIRYVLKGDSIKLYVPRPWPRIVCDPGVFNYTDGVD